MSPRNVDRDKELRHRRKQQILEAAYSMFTRKGVSACKMSDIARESNLSHGNIYNYFSSKEELLKCIAFEGQTSYTELLETASIMEGSALDKIHWLSEAYLRNKQFTSYWIILQIQATDILSAEANEEIRTRMFKNLNLLAEIVRSGQREGTIDDGDPVEIALMISSMLGSISLWGIRGFKQSHKFSLHYISKLIRKSQ